MESSGYYWLLLPDTLDQHSGFVEGPLFDWVVVDRSQAK